jgi:hypothetical protein
MMPDALNLDPPYRCAVYFVPDIHSTWWQAGSAWLGRCAATRKYIHQPILEGITSQQQWACTSEPRRYGWHATLKAPFKIRPGEDLRSVLLGLQSLANQLPAFDLPAMHLSLDGGFMSLRPCSDLTQIHETAAACVKAFHRFASPLTEDDLARRRRAPLTPEQDRLMVAWGYPYVFDEFAFHFTLTNTLKGLGEEQQRAWLESAQSHFANLGVCRFDRIALFVEPQAGDDFELISALELKG